MGIYDTYHERNGNIVRYVGYSKVSEKICYKCIHFNTWEDKSWCIEEEDLTWNNAPYCKEYKEKKSP